MEKITKPETERFTQNTNDTSASYRNIPGWGIDADPKNEPTYPMKNYNGADHQRLNYQRPPLQQQTVEVLHSNERPGLTAVYGTTSPPSGLSGQLRRFAFRYSEGKTQHWMTLILADRVNAVEGILSDLRRGHIPNIFAERGWNAEWKFNRKGMITKLAATVLITTAVIALMARRRRRA